MPTGLPIAIAHCYCLLLLLPRVLLLLLSWCPVICAELNAKIRMGGPRIAFSSIYIPSTRTEGWWHIGKLTNRGPTVTCRERPARMFVDTEVYRHDKVLQTLSRGWSEPKEPQRRRSCRWGWQLYTYRCMLEITSMSLEI